VTNGVTADVAGDTVLRTARECFGDTTSVRRLVRQHLGAETADRPRREKKPEVDRIGPHQLDHLVDRADARHHTHARMFAVRSAAFRQELGGDVAVDADRDPCASALRIVASARVVSCDFCRISTANA
jgi:hypothetical protein